MQLSAPGQHLRDELAAALEDLPGRRIGVAVSGGGDSMALLHLLAGICAQTGAELCAATVDHGLRPEAADEAAFVARACAALGIAHTRLHWSGWHGAGNLQAEARAARYRLLAGWARENALDCVALGHTRDDIAETFLMRLARQAGVDGLAAMRARISRDGACFVRPLLGASRDDLRGYLTRHGLTWCDDPSNDDRAYDRVRARAALQALAPLGLGAEALAGVASNIAAASQSLKAQARARASEIAQTKAGAVVFDAEALAGTDPELSRRLLVGALKWVSGADYAPRRAAVAELEAALAAGKRHTLNGCLVHSHRGATWVQREPAALAGVTAPLGALWDGRWRLSGPGGAGLELRALGDGLSACPDWRARGLPRLALMATPAVWQGDRLVSAPLAGLAAGYWAEIDQSRSDFAASLFSH